MDKAIDEQGIRHLACGSRFLGAGGGGNSYALELLAIQVIRDMGPVPLLSAFELGDMEWVIPVGIMGSPTILSEKILSGRELIQAIRILESEKGISAGAVAGLEIGGMNAITPVLAAALSRLPLLDGDGMGRAFPELQMTTYHSFGIQAAPFIMVNEQGAIHRMTGISNWEVEHQARRKVTEMGGWAAFAGYPMPGLEVREVIIQQTFSLAKRLGEAVSLAKEDVDRVMEALVRTFENSIYGCPYKLMEGKVVNLERDIIGGLLNGALVVEGTGIHVGEQLKILFKNEYLLAGHGEQPLAMVPDLICVLDADTGYPIMIEELENHRKVWVLAIPAPSLVRDAKMLEVVGPACFGVASGFTPIEQLLIREGGETHHVPFGY
ncbi:DUF917 domain-containing protein [Paenactinomyces guangxiensis]|uniref:DUF917 domain-containing protein n=1 Tax=Paenactinomyces guangxiensis TaxID=1490290 RepID=A0A7W2A7N4_9BACL|nr:DUF917 domain-containing protein [Paenactinomyces guangxiensis]MBA4493309.1 DUF917 domain-containing protein [Paenactinomyces guangxiensis]MBH8589840.1 DUF917 domain-containing protein [Paenactinomyces guangxiensis]